ncbi:MAG TPA: IS21 family transposase [Acidimicrobiales bacterium]|nr:IS21 family transposase [Acidimicrobiales bacterium]
MMTQEEYMDLLALRRQGKTIVEIAEELDYHPATVSKWLKAGGPPPARTIDPAEAVIDTRWATRIDQLIRPPAEKLLATSVFEIIRAEGFDGSYPSVVRHLRARRGPRFRSGPDVSVPIETAPAEEAQFDFSDCAAWTTRWGLGEVVCFGAILCWSRWRTWWFTTSVDAEHTFEGLVRFFEAAGGVPKVSRTDRMGALGRSQGRRFRLHPAALDFARHHGTEITACQAGDAKRKGKTERPFRELKESFLTECDALGAPSSIDELNARGEIWIAERVHARAHSTTGVAPAQRLETERSLLGPLPRRRFDTAYVEPRRVHPKFPFVEWGGVPYSVVPAYVGQMATCRVEVDSPILVVTCGGTEVARHRLDPDATEAVWDPAHRAAAEAFALGRARPCLRLVPPPAPEPSPRLELPGGDYDVDPPDLVARYGGCGCNGAGA